MMRAYSAIGEQCAGCLPSDRNVQQTVSVKVPEFAPLFLDELGTAEPVNSQANTREAQCFGLESIHCRQARAAKYAGAGEQ